MPKRQLHVAASEGRHQGRVREERLRMARDAARRVGQGGLESEVGTGSRFWIELKTAPFTSPRIRG